MHTHKFLRSLPRSLLSAALVTGILTAAGVFAVDGSPPGLFELDGNTVDTAAPGDDWDSIYLGTNLGAPIANTGILNDEASVTIFTQGTKDIGDLDTWTHTDGNVPDKNEITNAYAAAYINPNNVVHDGEVVHQAGDMIIYFGLDRYANNGDAYAGFWFYQNDVGLGPNGTFEGLHTARQGEQGQPDYVPGDLLVLVEYPQGSNAQPTVKVYEWDPVDADHDNVADNLDEIYGSETAKCDGTGDKLACAITNVNALTNAPAWPYTPKSGPASDLPKESFFEGGINVTRLLGGASPCFSSFLAETRASRSETAELKDFVLGNFDVCGISVTKNCEAEVSTEDGGNSVVVNFSGEVTNSGGLALDNVTVSDDMGTPGDTADDQVVFGPATLQPGETQPYSGSYETTAIPATDEVTATGTHGTATVDATADATCSPQVSPAITVDKVCTATVNGTGTGVDVLFSGTVTNTGNVALEDVTVVDDHGTADPADDVTVNLGTINAGGSKPYSGGFGSLGSSTSTDHVVASGTDVLTETEVSANAEATCLADTNPQADLFSACESRINDSGTALEIVINGTLTNTGNVLLNAITLLDDNGTPGVLTDDVTLLDNASLAVGASLTFSRTFTGTDLNAVTALSGTFRDGLGGDGVLLSLNEIAACPPTINRAIQVTKQCVASVNSGGTAIDVLFSGTVTNTGNLALENVDVVDDNGTPGNLADDVTVLENATLAPGASLPFNGSFGTGSTSSTDVVTASGQDVFIGTSVSDTDTATCAADVNPAIAVTKQCVDATAFDQPILFNGTVTNTGNTALLGVTVVDDNGTPGDTSDDVTFPIANLAPGASANYNGSYSPGTGTFTNTVLASASDAIQSGPYSATASATCEVPPPPPEEEGCTPGFWKNSPGSWTGYTPNQLVGSVFSLPNGTLNNQLGDDSLIEALGYPGGNNLVGAAQILLRAAVASLLNASHADVDFPLTTAQVITQVNAALATKDRGTILALASELDGFNNLGCDLPNDNSF